jgi:hypothetical protein
LKKGNAEDEEWTDQQRGGDGTCTRAEDTDRNKSASEANEGESTAELFQLCNWKEDKNIIEEAGSVMTMARGEDYV